MKQLRPIVKYHGGKGRLFRWIVPLLADHRFYCEPFGGAASVLLNKQRSEWEIYNDIEPTIVNLLKVVRDDLDGLLGKLKSIRYEKEVYIKHKEVYLSEGFKSLSPLDRATATYVVKRMSRGGLGGTFCWSDRIYSTGPSEVHCWNTAIGTISDISARLQGVIIYEQNALELIKKIDNPETMFYLDPPYLHSTRFSPDLYLCEMHEEDHLKLIQLAKMLNGKVAISGYWSEMYESELNGWRCTTKDTANHSSHESAKGRMTECLWVNY